MSDTSICIDCYGLEEPILPNESVNDSSYHTFPVLRPSCFHNRRGRHKSTIDRHTCGSVTHPRMSPANSDR